MTWRSRAVGWRYQIFVMVLVVMAGACGEGRKAGTTTSETGKSASAQPMCAEHGVPEALCTKCNPELAVVFQAKGDWCDEHGFPESFCPTCNPDARFPDVGAPVAAAADWCAGHGLPESKCTKCNPELIPGFKEAGDWCQEHGYPESACPVCNPQPAPSSPGAIADWCVEHGLPESKCTKCNTGLVAEYKASGDWCPEHGYPESVCPKCNPQEPPAGAEEAAIESRVVRFRSGEVEKSVGIATEQARRSETAEAVECTATIAFDGDRMADIRAIVPGIVRNVRVELGAKVEAGALLFDLESTRVGEIQGTLQGSRERLRTAEANLARQRSLLAQQIVSAKQVEVAEQEFALAQAEAKSASALLRMAGADRAAPSGRYTLKSPVAGTIVRRPAVVGVLATESTSLATVADTSKMWALCEVSEADAGRIAVGQTMQVAMTDDFQKSIDGQILWISAEVDPRTRTVTARAELPNPEGQLRAHQFARARIATSASRSAVTVPRASVQRIGDREVVFVRQEAGVYAPRIVKRYGDGQLVQVEGRLQPGDQVVTTGAVLLRTEAMPNSIGAGCCEAEAP